jgi:hypothetical protein
MWLLIKWEQLTTHIWRWLPSSLNIMILCEMNQITGHNSPARPMRLSFLCGAPTFLCSLPMLDSHHSLSSLQVSLHESHLFHFPAKGVKLILPGSAQMSPPGSPPSLASMQAFPPLATHSGCPQDVMLSWEASTVISWYPWHNGPRTLTNTKFQECLSPLWKMA